MTTTASKLTVFILGGTGTTGSSLVDGLLESGKYSVIVGVRPPSLSKPEISKLRERGVEVRAMDLSDAPEALDTTLKGVDVVISSMTYTEIEKQYPLIDAAKRVGVKRFVPDDWASACKRGVRRLYDQKAAVQDYVKSIGLGYTFIDVGIWMHAVLPVDKDEPEGTFIPSQSHSIVGTGDVKNALIHIPDIGKFTAEILDDPRTLNKYVFCCGDEKTQNEVWDIAKRVKLEVAAGEPLKVSPRQVSEEQVMEKVKSAKDGSEEQLGADYFLSLFIRGDNTLENAKKTEYGAALDGRELYPHLKLTTAEAAAKSMYKKE